MLLTDALLLTVLLVLYVIRVSLLDEMALWEYTKPKLYWTLAGVITLLLVTIPFLALSSIWVRL